MTNRLITYNYTYNHETNTTRKTLALATLWQGKERERMNEETLKKIGQGIYTYKGWRVERKHVWEFVPTTKTALIDWLETDERKNEYPTLRDARKGIDELTKEKS